jgi:hypothetical protein
MHALHAAETIDHRLSSAQLKSLQQLMGSARLWKGQTTHDAVTGVLKIYRNSLEVGSPFCCSKKIREELLQFCVRVCPVLLQMRHFNNIITRGDDEWPLLKTLMYTKLRVCKIQLPMPISSVARREQATALTEVLRPMRCLTSLEVQLGCASDNPSFTYGWMIPVTTVPRQRIDFVLAMVQSKKWDIPKTLESIQIIFEGRLLERGTTIAKRRAEQWDKDSVWDISILGVFGQPIWSKGFARSSSLD